MSQKLLLYMVTGNVMFLFLPTQMALMMSLLGVNLGGGTTAGLLTGGTSNLASNPLALVALSGGLSKRRSYRRRRPQVVYVRGGRRY